MKPALQPKARNLAALLPPLLVQAERVAATVHQGLHGRRRAGSGESFWQFRRYAPGDAAARIDWRQSARTDRYFVREREWEAAQSVYLWADNSGSMHFTSRAGLPQKTDYAHVLMLALASLLLRGGERVVWLGAEPVVARNKPDFERIAASLDLVKEGESAPPPVSFARHAHVILCSDFLMPEDDLKKMMRHYAALNLRGILIHILDPAEEDLPFEGRLELMGCEKEVPLLLPNAEALRDSYRRRMQEHKTRLLHYAESSGWFYMAQVTKTPPYAALMQVYQYLSADLRGL